MLLKISWPEGTETQVKMTSLRELDTFVARCEREGMRVDLKPWGLGLRVILSD